MSDVIFIEADDFARTHMEAIGDDEPVSFWYLALIRLRRDKLTLIAMVVLSMIAALSLGADLISEHVLQVDPNRTDLFATFEGASSAHLLGTDALGRDQLARLLYGGRVSLAIAFFGSTLALTLGLSVGMLAAFFGGKVDDFVMWFINTATSIPTIFLLLIVVALFEPSALWLTLILGFLTWFNIARLVRGEVFSVREREYVEAAKALGSSEITIMVRHILPNIIPIMLVVAAIDIGGLILTESALSFLGLGVQPPTATWGNMLTKAQQFIIRPDGRHLVVAPGVMITITVLCLYIIGDGLRDALDPRLR